MKEPVSAASIERSWYGWHGAEGNDEERSQPDATEKMGERWAPPSGRNPRSIQRFSRKGDVEIRRTENRLASSETMSQRATSQVIGYRPTCSCQAAAVPGVVLDPFAGLGTTLIAALRLGRSAIGIELSEKYAEAARKRILEDAPLFNIAAR